MNVFRTVKFRTYLLFRSAQYLNFDLHQRWDKTSLWKERKRLQENTASHFTIKIYFVVRSLLAHKHLKDEAQTALFKDPVRTAL